MTQITAAAGSHLAGRLKSKTQTEVLTAISDMHKGFIIIAINYNVWHMQIFELVLLSRQHSLYQHIGIVRLDLKVR